MKTKLLLAAGLTLGLSAFAQTNSQSTMVVEPMEHTPTFRVTVVSRSIQAVNYKHRGGATKLDFAGTDLMPQARGQAKVESKKGYIEIEVEFANLERPTSFGNEYLTYILWAISPEGRAVNLGEILVGDNHRSKVDVTTDLQAFALIVTAEPYYAVRQPSNVVVLENVVREDTKGTTEAMHAKYELLERGGYIPTGYKFDPVVLNTKLPLEFFEARNALRIAQSEGAETYAADTYQHAVRLMNKVDEDATDRHTDRKAMIGVAREAVQTAEDARAITVKKIDQERLDNERQAAANAQAEYPGAGRRCNPAERSGPGRPGPSRTRKRSGRIGHSQSSGRRGQGPVRFRPGESRYGEQPGGIRQCTLRRPGRRRPIPSGCAAGPVELTASRSRQSGHAGAIVRTVEQDSSDSRQRARPHRQHVRCFV